jgi:hypothetical protein
LDRTLKQLRRGVRLAPRCAAARRSKELPGDGVAAQSFLVKFPESAGGCGPATARRHGASVVGRGARTGDGAELPRSAAARGPVAARSSRRGSDFFSFFSPNFFSFYSTNIFIPNFFVNFLSKVFFTFCRLLMFSKNFCTRVFRYFFNKNFSQFLIRIFSQVLFHFLSIFQSFLTNFFVRNVLEKI